MLIGRIGVRWLLLGVGLSGLLLPVLAIVGLRAFDLYLVQEAERRLLGQGAVNAQAYRLAWCQAAGITPGDPRPVRRQHERFTPCEAAIVSFDGVASPLPEHLPADDAPNPIAQPAGQALHPLLRDSQVYHLSAVRILDHRGCVVATSCSAHGTCLSELDDVKSIL